MCLLPRASLVSVAVALLASTLLASTALAQAPQPSLTVTLDASTLSLGASNSTTMNGTVAYADTAPAAVAGTVTLTVLAPPGWTVAVDPSTPFTLAPGGSAPFTVTITAPDAGVGDANATAAVRAASTDQAGRTATATSTIALTRVDPPPPPAPTPFFRTPLGIATIVGAVLLVLAAATAVVVSRNRRLQREAEERAAAEKAAREAYLARETGIGIVVVDGPHPYGQRRELAWRLAIENRSDRPRVGVVEAVDVPAGWRAAPSLPKVPLSPGQRTILTVVVTPSPETPAGQEVAIIVRAKPEEALELDERVELDAIAPIAPAPLNDSYKPVVVQRLGANRPQTGTESLRDK